MINRCCSSIFSILCILIVLLPTDAWLVSSPDKTTARSSPLWAWSLLSADAFQPSTWYNEYNPTARATIYNDPTPTRTYNFVALGDDWPSSEPVVVVQTSNGRRRFNPLRRAWRRRSLRRQIMAHRRSSSSS